MSSGLHRKLKLVSAIGVFATCAFILSVFSETKPRSALEMQWSDRIEMLGATRAYEELVLTVSSSSPSEKHAASHAFGRALFEASGIEGLSICDPRPSYGCYHELIAQYLAKHGTDEIGRLGSYCDSTLVEAQTLTCKHGIGHGLLAESGYTLEGLLHALALCRDVSAPNEWGGCQSGAYMEYDQQSMTGLDLLTAEPRALIDGDAWGTPCDQVPAEDLEQCIRRRPYWWFTLLRDEPLADRFSIMGEKCRESYGHDAGFLRQCIAGIGRQIHLAMGDTFDVASMRMMCNQATDNHVDMKHCLEETAVAGLFFWGDMYAACACTDGRKAPGYCVTGSMVSSTHERANR